MTDDLKPCPFCGSPALNYEDDGVWFVVCKADCDATPAVLNKASNEAALAIWNRRASEPAAVETVRWYHEFQRADAARQRAIEILVGIHSLLNPRRIEANGNTYEFRDPNVPASERWQLLSDRIRKISDLASTAPAPRAADAKDAVQFPEELFDSYSVFQELTTYEQNRTSAENVGDVLDAAVRLMRKRAAMSAASQDREGA